MTIGIYCIRHVESGKRYIGKSVNVEKRLADHKRTLQKPARSKKHTNRYLYAAVQAHGWNAFQAEVLESFSTLDEKLIAERELHWMDHFRSCDRAFGYNLRRDSSTRMEVHEETKALMSESVSGFFNPNFANYWTDEQKAQMSRIAKERHASGEFYGDEWKAKQSAHSTAMWQNQEKRQAMGRKVALKKQKYDYLQFTREGEFVRRWLSVEEIIRANPDWKWQNIYSACHGHKPTYRGFIWRQELKAQELAA